MGLLTYLALKTAYPEHKWIDYSGHAPKPRGYWLDPEVQRKFFEEAAVVLNIQKPEDWHAVRLTTLTTMGGVFIREQYDGSIIRGM
jgi:hypothetical protein